MAAKETKKHIVAKFVGGIHTRRVISKKDQDQLIGVAGVAQQDLVWEPGAGTKVDVTEVHEDVLEYLKKSPSFKISEVEAPVQPPAS